MVASDGAGSSEIGGGVGRMTTARRDRGRELDGGLVDIAIKGVGAPPPPVQHVVGVGVRIAYICGCTK